MLAARVCVHWNELRLAVMLVYHALFGWRLAGMRRRGRNAEADALVHRTVTGWSRNLFANLHCRLEIEGAEHVPRQESFVVMSNHQSKYDIPALIAGLDMAVGFVTKRELSYIPGVAFWMRQLNCLTLDRKDVSGGAAALIGLAEELKLRRMGFVIFPEGTRTRDPNREVQPFKRGALRLASGQGLAVLPVTLDGTHLLDLPAAIAATRRGGRVVRIRIDPLLHVPGTSAPARRKFMDDLYETICSNWRAIHVNWPQY